MFRDAAIGMALKMGFFGPQGGGIVEAQSHLIMPPVSSSMHAHARSCAYVCTRACTFGVHTFGAKFDQSCCLVLVLGYSSTGLVHVCTYYFYRYSQGRSTGGQGPQEQD